MKISAFYENIIEGAMNDGIDMKAALAQLKQDGMEKVYFSYDTLKNDTDEKIIKMIQELELGVEGLYGFVRFDRFPMDDSYQDMIDLAVKLNAGNILLVPGFITGGDKGKEKQILENMWTGLKNAVQYGKHQGIAVSIEDFDGLDAPYCRIDGVTEFLKNVPGLQFSFDTGNFVMYHEDEVEAFELFKDKICTVHLKDRGYGEEQPVVICADGEKVCTVPVGDGFIHIKEILLNLKQLGYDGGLIAEMYGHAAENMYDGIRKSVKWIRETWRGGW